MGEFDHWYLSHELNAVSAGLEHWGNTRPPDSQLCNQRCAWLRPVSFWCEHCSSSTSREHSTWMCTGTATKTYLTFSEHITDQLSLPHVQTQVITTIAVQRSEGQKQNKAKVTTKCSQSVCYICQEQPGKWENTFFFGSHQVVHRSYSRLRTWRTLPVLVGGPYI